MNYVINGIKLNYILINRNVVTNEKPTNIEASMYSEFLFLPYLNTFDFTYYLMGQDNKKVNVSLENHLIGSCTCL